MINLRRLYNWKSKATQDRQRSTSKINARAWTTVAWRFKARKPILKAEGKPNLSTRESVELALINRAAGRFKGPVPNRNLHLGPLA